MSASASCVQLAQVFIVDTQLRQQLEAEVRNEIRLKSEQSNVLTQEQSRLAEMASEGRVAEQKLASDREGLRRQEELELVEVARRRRMQAKTVATDRQAMQLEQERFQAEMAAEQDRVTAQAPVRLLSIAREAEVLREELAVRRLRNEGRALEVEQELALPRAQLQMRLELLPVEQAPRIVEAASTVLHGTNLSIYGENAQLVGQLAPVFEVLGNAVRGATAAGGRPGSEPEPVGTA